MSAPDFSGDNDDKSRKLEKKHRFHIEPLLQRYRLTSSFFLCRLHITNRLHYEARRKSVLESSSCYIDIIYVKYSKNISVFLYVFQTDQYGFLGTLQSLYPNRYKGGEELWNQITVR